MTSSVVRLPIKSKRHKLNANPQWACKECCAVAAKPRGRSRHCNVCGELYSVRYFDSERELKRWAELKLLEKAGVIRNLELKPVYRFVIEGKHLKTLRSYEADARYFEGNRCVVEDSKGMRTWKYRLKMELMAILYPGITITEV